MITQVIFNFFFAFELYPLFGLLRPSAP